MIQPVGSRLPPVLPPSEPSILLAATNRVKDSIISVRPPEAEVAIRGPGLYAKSAAALALGMIPFSVAKGGQGLVRASGWIAQCIEKVCSKLGFSGRLLGYGSRFILSLPMIAGALLLFSGATSFSRTQQCVWGKTLVEFPQEERTNTKLARYGAGAQPGIDVGLFVIGFLGSPLFSPERQVLLSKMRNFEIT